jgi:hypothetical protein
MVFPPEEGKAGNEVALTIGQAFSVHQILISETNMLYLRSFEQNIKVFMKRLKMFSEIVLIL